MAQDHGARNGRVKVQEHSFAGHGDAGKMAALIAAGFGYEKNPGAADAKGEVVFQVGSPDGEGLFYFIVFIVVGPGVKL